MAQSHAHANGTLASMFAHEATVYTKVVAGFTIPVVMPFHEGDTLTALQARALSNYFLERGASVANSNIDRGAWKDLTDDEKIAKTRGYLNGEYNFSDDIGSGLSLLNQAATAVLIKLNGEKLAGMDEAAQRKAVEGHLARFLNTDGLAEKYGADIKAEIDAILATRHAKRTRAPAADKVEVSF